MHVPAFRKDDPDKLKRYNQLIDSYFQQNNNFGKYSFKGMYQKMMQNISKQFFHIIAYYFSKYSEAEFHRRMKQMYVLNIKSRDGKEPDRQVVLKGFDWIGDWKKFHKTKFIFFIKSVKGSKDWFVFNEEQIFAIIMQLLDTKGWKITDEEKENIQKTVRRLYNILYLDWDSID
jgi:hypothetical protein